VIDSILPENLFFILKNDENVQIKFVERMSIRLKDVYPEEASPAIRAIGSIWYSYRESLMFKRMRESFLYRMAVHHKSIWEIHIPTYCTYGQLKKSRKLRYCSNYRIIYHCYELLPLKTLVVKNPTVLNVLLKDGIFNRFFFP
jgi:hypothetical protein